MERNAPEDRPGAFPDSATGGNGASRLASVKLWGAQPVSLYVTVVASAGALLTAWLLLTGRFHLGLMLTGTFWPADTRRLLFAGFVLIGELFSLTVPRGNDTAEVTTSPTFAFGLLLGWGIGWALTALVVSAVVADLVRRKPLRKVFFNAGQYALAIGVAGIVFRAIGGGPGIIRVGDLLPVLAAAAAFFLVNFSLMAVAIGLTQNIPVLHYVRKNFVFTASVTSVLLSMSPVVVVLAKNSPILVPLLTLPLAAVYMGASASLKNTRLEELNQLKDDFVAMVSHELRTPLTSIQGSVKTLIQLGRDLDDDQRQSFLEAVDRQSDRLRRLIERLLVVARLEARAERVSFSPVPLRTLCEYVVFELRPGAGSHSFQFDFEPELIEVETDEGKVHQIISNLAENAVKYSSPDSRITVRCRAEDDAVVLTVEDQGPGIPAESRDRIFDRFYQVDQSRTRHVGGTGLGLYICRKLADAIGGELTLDDSYGNGCRFQLRLPRQHAHELDVPHEDLAVHESAASARAHELEQAEEPDRAAYRRNEELTRGRVVAFLSALSD